MTFNNMCYNQDEAYIAEIPGLNNIKNDKEKYT